MKAAAYYRVSTQGQSEADKFGLPAQREAVEKFAAENNLEIVAEFEDAGFSGATADRPALAEMLERAAEFERVLVYRWDRLARESSLDGFIRYRLKASGAIVLSATETNGIDAISSLTQTILAAVAQYERHLISFRLHNARKLKRARGGFAGGKPGFGYQALGDGNLIPHPAEHPVLLLARDLRSDGMEFAEIAALLNFCEYRSRTGRPFRKSTIHGMLAAQVNVA